MIERGSVTGMTQELLRRYMGVSLIYYGLATSANELQLARGDDS